MKILSFILIIIIYSCGVSQQSPVYEHQPRDPVLNNRNVIIGWTENEVNKFIQAYIRESITDLQMSRYWAYNASLQRVRDLAEQIVSEHAENNNRLNEISIDLGISASLAIENEALQDTINKLITQTGLTPDKAYIEFIIKSHEYLIQQLERAQSNILNTRLKNWVDEMLPLETKHLRDAEDIRLQLR